MASGARIVASARAGCETRGTVGLGRDPPVPGDTRDQGGGRRPRARLPREVPEAIREFVRCRRDRLELDPGRLAWLPRPEGVPIPEGTEPSVTLEPGEHPGTVNVSVGWGFVSLTLPVSVADGRLRIDTSNIPFLGDDISRWVDDLNADLAANGKRFDEVRLRDGKAHLTKAAVAAGDRRTSLLGTPGRKVAAGVAALTLVGGATLLATRGGNDGNEQASPSREEPVVQQVQEDEGSGTTGDPLPSCTGEITGADGPGGLPRSPEIWADPAVHGPCEYSDAELALPGGPYPVCEGGCAPVILLGPPRIDIFHDGSVPDALTGETGLSRFGWDVWTNAPGGTAFRVTTECAGRTVAGQATADPGGLVPGASPLFSYGPCGPSRASVLDESGTFPLPVPLDPFGFEVGPSEGPANPLLAREHDLFGSTGLGTPQETAERLDALDRLLDTVSGAPVDPGTFWFFEGDAEQFVRAIQASDPQRRWWVFYGSASSVPYDVTVTDGPKVAGFGASTTDPLGAAAELLFANTIFPCGPGRAAYTVCGGDPAATDPGEAFLAGAILDAPLPVGPGSEPARVGFALDLDGQGAAGTPGAPLAGPADGAELVYEATYDPDDGWTLTATGRDGSAVPTAARLLVRNHALLLVAPLAETGGSAPAGYRAYALDADGKGSAGPGLHRGAAVVVPGPLPIASPELESAADDGDTGPGPTAAAGPTEAPEAFVRTLAEALRAGDAGFLLDRLHPAVLDRYGAEACRSYVGGVSDPTFELTVQAVSEPGPYDWELDGVSTVIPDAVTVTVERTQGGGVTTQDMHIAPSGGGWRWFTDCGDPR